MTLSQHGFIKLSVLLAAVFGLGLGASGYLNYAQHQRSAQDEKLLQGQIVDLRYQVSQDKLAMGSPSPSPGPSGSPSPSPDPSPSPTSTPAVAGASTSVPMLVKACNLHAKASASSTTLVRYTSFTGLPLPVALNGGKTGSFQNITVNGKTGFVESSCLQY